MRGVGDDGSTVSGTNAVVVRRRGCDDDDGIVTDVGKLGSAGAVELDVLADDEDEDDAVVVEAAAAPPVFSKALRSSAIRDDDDEVGVGG